MLLVAVGAVNTRLFCLVAIDAGTHRDVNFEIEPVALGDLPVAFPASTPHGEVRLMAEHDVGGNLVNARPPDAMDTLAEVCQSAGFEVLHKNEKMFPPGHSIHELGTCRMGENPKTSVLNKWNQSHDIKNLFVVDGSSFVTGGSQNPTITIVALAMRASEYLAEQLRKGDL